MLIRCFFLHMNTYDSCSFKLADSHIQRIRVVGLKFKHKSGDFYSFKFE